LLWKLDFVVPDFLVKKQREQAYEIDTCATCAQTCDMICSENTTYKLWLNDWVISNGNK
jgi:hypothetical protein